ncbi:MAG: C45 family autoproteolytic acyltransferase/hydrolase [Promethearchaeota archaeon]
MKFNENAIIDNSQSFMTVRHLVIKGKNVEIGKKLAELAIKRHGFSSENIKNENPLINQSKCKYFEKNYPIHLDRAQGVAEALNFDFEEKVFDFTSIPYNQYVPSQLSPIACSSIFFPPLTTVTGQGYLSRNFDFSTASINDLMGIPVQPEVREAVRPLLGDPYVIELYPEDNGYASLCLASFDLLSGVIDGINSEGLVVCVNGDEIAMKQQGKFKPNPQGIGFHELQAMRFLLDTCATVKEAKKALLANKHYYSFLPCHYLIADRDGNSFVFEFSHERNSEHIIEDSNKPQVMTNHPLYLYPSVNEFPEKASLLEAGTSSFTRYEKITEMLSHTTTPYSVKSLKEICKSVSVSKVASWIPDNYRQQLLSAPGFSRTLWHCIYNSTTRSLEIKFYLNDKIINGDLNEYFSDYFQFGLEN